MIYYKLVIKLLYFRKKIIRYLLNTYLPSLRGVKITCNSLSDGAGAVFLRIYTAIVYSAKIGAEYVHTPISTLEHNYNFDTKYEKKWEEYFRFLVQYKRIKNTDLIISINSFTQVFIYFIFYKYFYAKRIVFKYKFHNLDTIGLNPSEFISTNNILKSYLNIKKTNFENIPSLNIVIHVRRGDVSIKENYNRFTHNSEINLKIITLKNLLKNSTYIYKIHLISQGKIEDFLDITNVDCYHLGCDPIEDFDKMKNADILFTSKSSFSYLAAIFCSGVVIYEQFWLSPLRHWIESDKMDNIPHSIYKY